MSKPWRLHDPVKCQQASEKNHREQARTALRLNCEPRRADGHIVIAVPHVEGQKPIVLRYVRQAVLQRAESGFSVENESVETPEVVDETEFTIVLFRYKKSGAVKP